MLEICLMINTLENLGRTTNPKILGIQFFPNMPVFNEYGIIGGAFLLPLQEDDVSMPHDKIPVKTGETVNLTKVGIPIHPRWQSLLNMIFLVAHFFYFLKKMATSYGSGLLQ